MQETGKPIIAVAVNEDERASSARLRRTGFFTASTPERAVFVASRLARYGSSRRPVEPGPLANRVDLSCGLDAQEKY